MRELIKSVFKDHFTIDKDLRQNVKDYIFNILKGKNISDSKGNKYKATNVECSYLSADPDGHFFSVNIYLSNYKADNYFLYYDSVFEDNIDNLISVFSLEYSESGMQGDDYLNFDVSWRGQ